MAQGNEKTPGIKKIPEEGKLKEEDIFGPPKDKAPDNIIPVEPTNPPVPPEEQLKLDDILSGPEIDPLGAE